MDWNVIGLAALIVVARIVDVSLGTLRTVAVVTGRRGWAFVLGFLEVLVWITVVGQLIANLNHWLYFPAYALGFALGSVVGITIEQRIAFGTQVVRVFSRKSHAVATALRALSFQPEIPHLAVTEMEAKGHKGPVGVLFAEVPRKYAAVVADRAIQVDPEAYFVIDDVRRASSMATRTGRRIWWQGFLQRK